MKKLHSMTMPKEYIITEWHSRMRSEVESAQKLSRSIEDNWYQSIMTTIFRIYFKKFSFHLKIYNFIQQR